MDLQNLPLIQKIKIDRALIYISKEIREALKWESKEDVLGIAFDSMLILIKPNNVNSIRSLIDETIKRLELLRDRI